MFNIKQIKSLLTPNKVISLMETLGADYKQSNDKEIHFKSICHNSSSYKLYYYVDRQSFYCHRCGEQWDIISLVQKIQNSDFLSAIEFICNICGISKNENEPTTIDNWQSMKKFLPHSNYVEPLITYDESVLSIFEPLYHKSWLDDGISKKSMDKFNIGWYRRNEQISIPVLDVNGDLIGIHARNTKKSIVDKGYKYQPLKTINNEYNFPTGRVLYGLYQNQQAINSTQSAIIVEAPKSVLQAEDILKDNTTIALFGWNCNKEKRDILLNQNIKEVTIALDKQYKEIHDEEFNVYARQVKKIAELFAPYCTVYVVWDKSNLLGYKDSPFDRGKDVWEQLNQIKTRYN